MALLHLKILFIIEKDFLFYKSTAHYINDVSNYISSNPYSS